MSNLQRFGTFTPEAAAADKEAVDASRPRAPFWTPEEGENVIRMFPPLPGFSTPWVTCWQHFLKLPWLKQQTGINCPRVMAKQPCPVCALAQKMSASTDPTYRKMAESLTPSFRAFAVIIDRNAPEKGPQIWGFSKGLYDEMVLLRQNARAGGDFCDPDAGIDFVLNREGKDLDTRYKLALDRHSTPLGTDGEIDYWLESFPDFRAKAELMTEAEITDALGNVPAIKTSVAAAPPRISAPAPAGQLPQAARVASAAASGARAPRFAQTTAPTPSTVTSRGRSAAQDLDEVGDNDPDLD